MKHMLTGLALLAGIATAQAQTVSVPQDVNPPADPLEVKPVAPAKPSRETPEASAIRSRLEAFGYADISDLDRDSTGVWHAHASRDNSKLHVVVDKGGRIIPQSH